MATLRITTWNCNGLVSRINEIEYFLNDHKIDILLISESHLTRHTHVSVKGYMIYNAVHPSQRPRGGASIIIKNNIEHQEEEKIENEMFQIACVSVSLKNNKTFKICAIYSPPRHNIKSEHYIEVLKGFQNHFILGGDFNAKNKLWGSRLTTPKGHQLHKACRALKCEIYSGNEPTYWPSNEQRIPDLIDFFVTKNIPKNFIYIENTAALSSSDHSAVIMTVSDNFIEKETPSFLSNNRTNWQFFKYILSEKIELKIPLRTKDQIDEELTSFINAIQTSAWESTPTTSHTNTTGTYPKEIRDLLSKKRKARKKWQRERTIENKRTLNRLVNELKRITQESKNKAMSRYLGNLTATKETNYNLWKATRQLNQASPTIPPLKNVDGSWVKKAEEKVDLFANYFSNIFKPLECRSDNEETYKLEKCDNQVIKPATIKELENLIAKDLSAKKSPGYDLITTKILKKLPHIAVKKLLFIINACFRLRHVPLEWKVAEVIVIKKSGKPDHEITSYRPISLLPVMSKIFEKLLLKRLRPLLTSRLLIPDHQFGFRNNHSTIQQVHRIVDIAERAIENKLVCSAVFLDVGQAFDKVWHQGLLTKLHNDLPTEFYEILESYLTNRHFRVKIENNYSKLKPIKAGVPQGSVLGPVLYLLYTRDIPNPPDATIATFADDTAILTTANSEIEATNKLQAALSDILLWINKWRMNLNENKSIHILFTNKELRYLPLYLNGKVIPFANTAKYLGMTLDTKIKWKEHVKKKNKEIKIKFSELYWMLVDNRISIQNKLLLYNQMIKPIWTYGIQLWGCAAKNEVEKIQKTQNLILRTIANAPWYIRNTDLHRDLGVRTISEEISIHALKHANKLHSHVNSDLNNIVRNYPATRRLQRTIPMDLVP